MKKISRSGLSLPMPQTPLQYMKAAGHDIKAYTGKDMQKIYKMFERELKQYGKDVTTIIKSERTKRKAEQIEISEEIIESYKQALQHPGWTDGAGQEYILMKIEQFRSRYGAVKVADAIIQMEQGEYFVTPEIYYNIQAANRYMVVFQQFLLKRGMSDDEIKEMMYADAEAYEDMDYAEPEYY